MQDQKVGYFYSGISGASLVGNDIKDKKVEDIMSMPVVIKQDTNIYDVYSYNVFI